VVAVVAIEVQESITSHDLTVSTTFYGREDHRNSYSNVFEAIFDDRINRQLSITRSFY
jgi:hypothetical protein